MSELQRHTDAVDVELQLHQANARSIDELQAEVTSAQAKARRATMMFGIVCGLMVLGSIVLSIFTVLGRNDTANESARLSKENGAAIDSLTTELRSAQELLAARDDEATDLILCGDAFVNRQRSTNLEAFATFGELVIALIPEQPPIPADERAETLRELRDQLRIDTAAYRDVVDLSKQWIDAGRPLPCPI